MRAAHWGLRPDSAKVMFYAVLLAMLLIWAIPATADDCPPPPPPKFELGGKLLGVDVSHHQGNVRWDLVKNQGMAFAFVKATGGETYIDPLFEANWHLLRTQSLPRGAYHFFFAGDSAEAQAALFLTTVRKLRPKDLPPVLDLEITDCEDEDVMIERALTWLDLVEKGLKRRPIIYTSRNFALKYLDDARFARYHLWLADYGPDKPEAPAAWKDRPLYFWQHSQDQKVQGIDSPVDLNYFFGSHSELMELILRSHQAD